MKTMISSVTNWILLRDGRTAYSALTAKSLCAKRLPSTPHLFTVDQQITTVPETGRSFCRNTSHVAWRHRAFTVLMMDYTLPVWKKNSIRQECRFHTTAKKIPCGRKNIFIREEKYFLSHEKIFPCSGRNALLTSYTKNYEVQIDSAGKPAGQDGGKVVCFAGERWQNLEIRFGQKNSEHVVAFARRRVECD